MSYSAFFINLNSSLASFPRLSNLLQKLEITYASETQILIAEMEQAIDRLKRLSAAYNQIPLALENSIARKRLYDRFEQERAQSFMAYGQDKSFRLEALNSVLFLEFNQYLIDYVTAIDDIYQSPTFT